MALHENFHETITTENKVLEGYQKLYFTHNLAPVFESKNNHLTNRNTAINASLFPSYLQPEFYKGSGLEVVKIPQKKITGYAILINNHNHLEAFFKAEYKKNFRANILRFVNRFETCFNATYKLFYGDIAKADYTFLMASLHTMLTHRFDQRNDSNKVLKNWDTYLHTTFDLIQAKKASLFVIYHNTKPVHICINHHFNNILFVSVPSYDIDYAKFALGNISLYKLLEWCINNHYEVMDMAQGYLEYKRRWSTLIYHFDHHILYHKENKSATFGAWIEMNKLYFKNFLKSMHVDTLIEQLKQRIKKQTAYQETLQYQLEDTQIMDTTGLKEINEHSPIYPNLRKPINDFLYTHKEQDATLKIVALKKEKEYLLQGQHASQKLIIK